MGKSKIKVTPPREEEGDGAGGTASKEGMNGGASSGVVMGVCFDDVRTGVPACTGIIVKYYWSP